MFEKIWEKIVLNFAKDYIEDFSKENMKVGVWNGDIKIENVKLNPNLLKKLNIPFKIKYSCIKFLNIKIPWKSLSYNPCEIEIHGVYILLEPNFNMLNENKNFNEELFNLLKFKKDELLKYTKILKENIKFSFSNDKNSGFFSSIIEKIIDNLQINIKNIHCRIELNEQNGNKSFGFTLENLSVFTCDKDWNKEFFVRQDLSSKLFKKLEIENFNFYWNSKEKLILNNLSSEEIELKMNELIKRGQNNSDLIKNMNYLLNFSTFGQLILNPKINETVESNWPFYDLKIILNDNKIELLKYQFNDILNFITKYIKYNELLKRDNDKYVILSKRPDKYIRNATNVEEKKIIIKQWFKYIIKLGLRVFSENNLVKIKRVINLKLLNKEDRLRFIKIFFDINTNYNDKIDIFLNDNDNYEDYYFFKKILLSYDFSYIMKIIKTHIIKEEAIEKIKENENKSKTWFSGFFNNNEENDNEKVLNKDELQQIENSIKDNLKITMIKTSDNYSFLKLDILQEKFKINFKISDDDKSQMILSKINGIFLNLNMKNNGIKCKINIKDLNLIFKEKNEKIKFFYNSEENDNLITINYEDKPELSDNIDTKINIEIKKINYFYYEKIIKFFGILFKVPIDKDIKEVIKNKTSINMKKLQNLSENKIKDIVNIQKKILFNLIINSPNIFIPLENNLNQKFLLKPGELKIQMKTFDCKEIVYDNILLNLNNMSFEFIYNDNSSYSLLNDIDLKIDFFKLKNILNDLTNDNYKYKINLLLHDIVINIDYDLVNKINLLLNNFFILDKSKRLKNKNIKNGYINVNHNNIEYLGIYEEKILYLFKSLEDEKIFAQINLENIIFIENGNNINFNGYNLLFKDSNDKLEFINKLKLEEDGIYKFLNENIKNYMINTDDIKFNNIEEKWEYINNYFKNLKIIDNLINEFQINFDFKGFKINYKDNKNIYNEFQCKDFKIKLDVINSKTYLDFKLNNFYYKIKNNDKEYYILTTDINQSEHYNLNKFDNKNLEFIEFRLNLFSKFSQEFKDNKIYSDIFIKIGNIFVDINPIDINYLYFHFRNLFIEEKNEIIFPNNINSNKNYLKYKSIDQEIISNFLLNIEINSIDINFRTISGIRLSKILWNNLNLKMNGKEGSNKILLFLKDISLYDLTNYPNFTKNLDINDIQPNILLKKKTKSNSNFLWLNFEMLNDKFYIINNNINKNIKIDLNDIKIYYHQQWILRYIHYLNNQFMPILYQIIENRENEQVWFLEEIKKPFFNNLEININNSEVYLKNKKEKNIYCYMILEQIYIKSKNELSSKRINLDTQNYFNKGIFESLYIIDIYNIKWINVLDNNKNILLNPFNLKLIINLMMYENYYLKFFKYGKLLDNELIIDNSIIVDINCSSLFLNFGNFEYNSIMKYLNDFINNNDNKDYLFSENYIENNQINNKRSKIKVQISIKNIGIILISNNDNIEIKPLGKLFCNELNINIELYEKIIGNIKFKKLVGYYLEFDSNENKYYELGFIEYFNLINKYNKDELHNKFYKNIDFKYENDLKNNFNMNFVFENNSKNFNINLNDLKILFIINLKFEIWNIFNENKYINIINKNNFDYKEYLNTFMKVKIVLNNISLIILNENQEKCLITQSNIQILHSSYNSLNKSDLLKLKKNTELLNENNKNKKNTSDNLKLNMIKENKINASKFEVFLCNFNDFINNYTKNKRSLMLPLNIDLLLNQYKPFDFTYDTFYDFSENLIKIKSLNLNVSLKDIEILNDISNYNLYLYNNYILTQNNKNNMKKNNKKLENLNENLLRIEIENHIKVVLINDKGSIYTPMINIIISKINFLKILNQTDSLEINFKLGSLYFNSQSNNWEPLIEPCYFKIIKLNIKNKINQLDISLDKENYNAKNIKSILNINISDELLRKINIIKDMYINLKNKSKNNFEKNNISKILRLKNDKISQFNGFSNIIFVNQTGYPLYINNIIKYYMFDLNNNSITENIISEGEETIIDNNSSTVLKFNDIDLEQKNIFQMIKYKFNKNDNYIKEVIINEDIIKKEKIIFKNKTNHLIYIIKNYEDLRKVIISSTINLKNLTDKDFTFEFKNHKINICKNEIVGVPIDIIDSSFKLKNQKNNKLYDFKDLCKKKYLTVNISLENKIFNILLYSINNKYNEHLNEILIIPPLIFKNILPVNILLIISDNQNKSYYTINKNEKIEIYDFNLNSDVKIEIELDSFKMDKKLILIKDFNFKKINKIRLIDNLNFYNIIILNSDEENTLFYFKIFCEFVVINSSNVSLDIFKVNKNIIKVNEVNKDIYLIGDPKSYVGVKLNNNNEFNCKEFNINCEGINKSGSIIFKNKTSIFELGYNLTLVSLENNIINTKILDIMPKLIFCNPTKYNIILNLKCEKTMKNINRNTNEPIFIYLNHEKKISITFEIDNEYYSLYDNILANQIGNFINYIYNYDKTKYKIINTDIFLINNILYVKVEELTDSLIKLENRLNVDICVYQNKLKDIYYEVIKPNNEIDFAWVSNENPYYLKVESNYNDINNFYIDFNKNYNDLNIKNMIVIKSKIVNNSRKIIIKPYDSIKNKLKYNKNINEYQIKININNIGLSIISFKEKMRIEYFYVKLLDFNYLYYKSIYKTIMQLKIKFLQIDSNFTPYTRYPIFWTASKLQELMKDKNLSFLNCVIEKNNIKSDKIDSFDKIKFDIVPITITADQQLVVYFLELLNNYSNCFKISENSNNYYHYIFGIGNKINKVWEDSNNLDYFTKWIFINQLFIQKIKITLTFNLNDKIKEITPKDTNIISLLFETIGFTIINIDEAELNINGIMFLNIFKTYLGLTSMIYNILNASIKSQIFKIIGSLEVIGSPVQLIGNLGDGIYEFFNEPIEGFVKGPLEGVIGIQKGATSLIKNTISGTFNSISKITNSIGSGISVLSFDNEYKKNRELLKQNKPEHLFDGLGKGFETIGKGVFNGITGIVLNPVKGAQNEGAVGFFKGIFTGITGIVTKPISSIFDATSLTAEGIKRTFRYFDDKANEVKNRIPRVFYGYNQFFKTYNKKDSYIMKILILNFNNRFSNDNYFNCYLDLKDGKINKIYIITYQNLIIVDSEYQLINSKNIINISKIINKDNKLTIFNKANNEGFSIKFNNDLIKNIINDLNYIRMKNLN